MEKNNIKIKFLNKFYKKKVIDSTIESFARLADFKVVEEGQYTQVQIYNIKHEVSKNLKDEFCNYALYLMSK